MSTRVFTQILNLTRTIDKQEGTHNDLSKLCKQFNVMLKRCKSNRDYDADVEIIRKSSGDLSILSPKTSFMAFP